MASLPIFKKQKLLGYGNEMEQDGGHDLEPEHELVHCETFEDKKGKPASK